MEFLFFFLILLRAVTATPFRRQASSFPDPVPCKGDCSSVHDPAVIKGNDGTYWRFTTFDNITIASSTSMLGPWATKGSVLHGGSLIDIPDNDGIWAPDVYNVDGTYHLFYAVSKTGTKNSDIGLATSRDLRPGTWTDHGVSETLLPLRGELKSTAQSPFNHMY